MAFEVVLSTIFTIFCVQAFYSWAFGPLRSFPGPLLAKLTNLWRLYDVWTGQSEKTQSRLHDKYGKAVRYGPNCVIVNDPELIKVIYASRDTWKKTRFYTVNDFMIDGKAHPTTFSVRDESLHTAMTRPVSKLYTISNIVRYEPLIDSTIAFFLQQLQTRFVDTGKPCAIDKWLHYVAWDAVSEMTFSRRFGFLEKGQDIENLIETGYRAHVYFSIIGQIPILDKFLAKNPITPIGPPGFSAAAAFSAKQLAYRTSGDDEHNPTKSDFLDEFLSIRDATPGTSDNQIITWMLSNVLAGSDTTAIELRAVVYYLARNQRCVEVLQKGLDEADLGPAPQWKDVSQLPYLDAVVQEATREHPAVAMLLEREVPDEGLELDDGRIVPAGTTVGINPSVIHRSVGIYGDDADEFRPERWLRDKSESAVEYQARLKKMRETDLTFGHGKRACSGKNVAIVEMRKIIALLYREFNIRLVDGSKPWKTRNSWFHFQEGMDVYITSR